ncbi:hypothetical protein OH807_29155 [Kitasatospora sp. NBC_01560]|uniref:hypothetical protein n=1 Tax=Kitasatospora sp. NBC_01560 TaxID=2975965 RepID=UPI003869F3C1
MTGTTPDPSRRRGPLRTAGAVLAALALAALAWAVLRGSGLAPDGYGLARLAGLAGVKAVMVGGACAAGLGYYVHTRRGGGTDGTGPTATREAGEAGEATAAREAEDPQEAGEARETPRRA